MGVAVARMVCVVLAAFAATSTSRWARADAISSYGYEFAGILGATPSHVMLPDLTKGGTVTLGNGGGSLPIPNPEGNYPYPPTQQPINNAFGFLIGTVDPSASTPSYDGPWLVSVTGNLQGTIIGPAGSPPRYSGQFSGTATSVDVSSFLTSPLPPPLQDLVANPGRIHVSGFVTGGQYEDLDVTLTIDPATVVPEPATLTLFLTTAAGLVVWRCRRCAAGSSVVADGPELRRCLGCR